MLGFKRFDTTAVTIRGIELAEKINKERSVQPRNAGREAGHRCGNLGSGIGGIKPAKHSLDASYIYTSYIYPKIAPEPNGSGIGQSRPS
jgi:hypothetical protein